MFKSFSYFNVFIKLAAVFFDRIVYSVLDRKYSKIFKNIDQIIYNDPYTFKKYSCKLLIQSCNGPYPFAAFQIHPMPNSNQYRLELLFQVIFDPFKIISSLYHR